MFRGDAAHSGVYPPAAPPVRRPAVAGADRRHGPVLRGVHDGTPTSGAATGSSTRSTHGPARIAGSSAPDARFPRPLRSPTGSVFVGSRDNTVLGGGRAHRQGALAARDRPRHPLPLGVRERRPLHLLAHMGRWYALLRQRRRPRVRGGPEERPDPLALHHRRTGARLSSRGERPGLHRQHGRNAVRARLEERAGALALRHGGPHPRARASSGSTAEPSSPRPRWRTAASSSARATAFSTRWTPRAGNRHGAWTIRCPGSTRRPPFADGASCTPAARTSAFSRPWTCGPAASVARGHRAPVWSSPAVAGDMVYVGDGSGTVYALDRASGRERWRHQAGRRIFSSPVIADGVLYVGNDDGSVYAIRGFGHADAAGGLLGHDAGAGVGVVDPSRAARTISPSGATRCSTAARCARFLTARVQDRSPERRRLLHGSSAGDRRARWPRTPCSSAATSTPAARSCGPASLR